MDRKTQIWVAVVGVVGTIAGATISNIDKFRESGDYVATNDIETEIRRHVELSGLREAIQSLRARLESKYKEKYKLSDDQLSCVMDTSFFGNDYIDAFVEAHRKYMTLEEVKALNRIYSTDVMLNYRKKQDLILQDFMERMDRLAEHKYKTFQTLTAQGKSTVQACPAK
jgi:hypothetical protein